MAAEGGYFVLMGVIVLGVIGGEWLNATGIAEGGDFVQRAVWDGLVWTVELMAPMLVAMTFAVVVEAGWPRL